MPDYRLTIYQSLGGRSNRGSWANTYEFSSAADIADAEIGAAVSSFAAFQQRLQHPNVYLLRGAVHRIDDLQVGYDANHLRVFDLSTNGVAPLGTEGQLLDLNIALQIKRFSGVGRSGSIYIRGALTEGLVETDSTGKTVLSTNGAALFGAQLTTAGPDFFAAGRMAILWSKKKNAEDATVVKSRNVTALALAGAVVLKRDHKWFDRGPNAPA